MNTPRRRTVLRLPRSGRLPKEKDPRDLTEVVAVLTSMVRRASFLHLSYNREDQEFFLISMSDRGRRRAIVGRDLLQSVLSLAGYTPTFFCTKCKTPKPCAQFPPAYERTKGKSDGGRKYYCLECSREAARESARRKREMVKKVALNGLTHRIGR